MIVDRRLGSNSLTPGPSPKEGRGVTGRKNFADPR
jgi:hypothetical protein